MESFSCGRAERRVAGEHGLDEVAGSGGHVVPRGFGEVHGVVEDGPEDGAGVEFGEGEGGGGVGHGGRVYLEGEGV